VQSLIEEHLRDCEACDCYLDQLRQTIRIAGLLREEDVHPEVRATLVRAFRALNGT
jgi:hypothetical protein